MSTSAERAEPRPAPRALGQDDSPPAPATGAIRPAGPIRPAGVAERVEQGFERVLWGSRLVVLVAVVASALLALGTFYMATVDAAYLLLRLTAYGDPALTPAARLDLRSDAVTGVIKAVDGYLLAAILLVFAFGLYELFVNRIGLAERSEVGGRLLLIRTFDDLKDRLGKVVLLILVVKFLQQALDLTYRTPLDLLALAVGILLVGGALFLSGAKPGSAA